MVNIDLPKSHLHQLGAEMFTLCVTQLQKSIDAYLNQDDDLAESVIYGENRVNALVLNIDRECEQFLSLSKPLKDDLRYVMAFRKIIYYLKCIEKNAIEFSRFITESDIFPNPELLKMLRLKEMFTCTISMFADVNEAYLDQDNQQAHKVFRKEQKLNEINYKSISLLSNLIHKEVGLIDQSLSIYGIILKMESVGDLATSIAQEIIFYREHLLNSDTMFLV